MSLISEGAIYGLGNPLLDISACVDLDYLKKWNLEPNNAILADESHKNLPVELNKNFHVKYTAGGSCQNSLRVAQWVLRDKPKTCTVMGCISNDFYGKCMKDKAEEDGLNCEYLIDEKIPTGVCSVLITESGKNRSMVADLSAANHFKKDFLMKKWDCVEKAKICYVTGFHLTVCPEAEIEIAKHVLKSKDKLFAFNLSAPFIMLAFGHEVEKVVPYADIIFGNETEAEAYANMKKWDTKDLEEIAKLMVKEKKHNEEKQKLVIITNGSNPIIVGSKLEKKNAEEEDIIKIFKVDVEELKKEEIVDTNGAGDAFVGGFLAKLLLSDMKLDFETIKSCVRLGSYTAKEIIKQDGCSIPQHNLNTLLF